MFYYKNWEHFCQRLHALPVTTCTVSESLNIPEGQVFVALKHDVETNVPNAHRLAWIEKQNGICGSYYVQAYLLEDPDNVALLLQMQHWGHEISYHYDVLDAHTGNYEAAERDFKRHLHAFQYAGFTFGTICQHGNPVKKRIGYTSNRDFFRNPAIRNKYPDLVDVVVDYSLHTQHPYKYISDAGYCWNIITEPETNDLHPDSPVIRIGSLNAMLRMIEQKQSLIISTHPHRWKKSAYAIYTKIALFRTLRATVMTARRIPSVESILNRFYFLAKKI